MCLPIRLGKNAKIYDLARIIFPENISIGIESVVDDLVILYARGKGIEIGNFCHITFGCKILSGGLIRFEDFSAMGPGGIVLAQTDNYTGEGLVGLGVLQEYRKVEFGDVTLKKHAHVGAGAIILPGATIGEGCSVGAGSLVNKSLPDWTICVGVPCKPIKDKPREKQLEMEKEFLGKYYERKI